MCRRTISCSAILIRLLGPELRKTNFAGLVASLLMRYLPAAATAEAMRSAGMLVAVPAI
jgi:hypothetical protein